MVKQFAIGFFLWLAVLPLMADNLKLSEKERIVLTDEKAVVLVFEIRWNNSWRNLYNHDAVYLFGKYRTQDVAEWNHMIFDDVPEVHSAGAGFRIESVNGGRGLFLFRETEGSGESITTIRLKWKIAGNPKHPLDINTFQAGKVYPSIHGLETVYIPTAPFYAGDGSSIGGFSDPNFGMLPAEYDIIGTDPGFAYTGSTTALAAMPADRRDHGYWNPNDRHDWSGVGKESWWRVDFKTPKRILYFGVSGLPDTSPHPAVPATDWYLEGSPNATQWDTLWSGGPEYWSRSYHTYPIQRAIRVNKPGSYRYYRIRVKDNQREQYWNNVHLANVGMTETDLTSPATRPVLIDGSRTLFPPYCPVGHEGMYVMKYELTQEQYVVFLNQLNRSAQYSRTIGGILDGVNEGEFIFGNDRKQPSYRNGIVLQKKSTDTGSAYVFACNLNTGNNTNSQDDGQTLACNYLTPGDMLAYADWCGLRPLNELEYEKMSRNSFPYYPQNGELASGVLVADYGQGILYEGTEQESFTSGQINAGSKQGGPSRAGAFTKTGQRRQQGGLSFWGVSDLSGNLAEIYYNAEVYGRQFKANKHGDGQLNEFGGTDIGIDIWPEEAAAFGVRGGSYASGLPELAVSARGNAVDYFSSAEERKAEVGFRLGFSVPQTDIDVKLILGNGLSTGVIPVYDTVCDGSDYTIRCTHGEDMSPCHYVWYCSRDKGNSWQLLEAESKPVLRLSSLIQGVSSDTPGEFRYKCRVLSSHGSGESGVAGICVGNVYRIDRFSDTLRPCMESKGLTVQTVLPARFEWECLDNGRRLAAESETSFRSHYAVATADFQENGEPLSGSYTVALKIEVAGRCKIQQQFKVLAIPQTVNPFLQLRDTIVYSKDEYQIPHLWSGRDAQKWTIVNKEKGALSIDDRGKMEGLSTTLLNHVVVEAVCKDVPDKVYRKILHEPVREIKYTGKAQTMNFVSGEYIVECWGAQGGTMQSGYSGVGGRGGYARGELSLPKPYTLYLYVGGQGQGYNGSTNHYGGWNGGGTCYAGASGGGGATDIKLIEGGTESAAALYSRIIVAGGGGGSNDYQNGGYGGGLTGGTGVCSGGSAGTGGTQTTGGGGWLNGSLGIGAGAVNNYGDGGAGGGGYYGGGKANGHGCAGGGGSGFISGMEGCNAIGKNGVHTGSPAHYSGLVFKKTKLENGVQAGHGKIVITVLGNK